MRKTSIIWICCILYLIVGTATQTSANTWTALIRKRLSESRATLGDVKSPCQLVIRTNGVAVELLLSGIEPIPTEEHLARTQVVHQVAEFIHGLTNSYTFGLVLENLQQTTSGSNVCLGTLIDLDESRTMQYMLVANGYAQPCAGADSFLWQAYARAQKDRKGLWALLPEKMKGHNQTSEGVGAEVATKP